MAFVINDAVLPAQSAGGATATTIIGAVPSNLTQATWTVEKISAVSPSLVTGAATNYASLVVRQMRADVLVQNIGTLALSASSVTLPAEVEVNIPITNSGPLLDGDILDVQQTQTGTGLAFPAGIVVKAELA
jgi:hypothetical protein